MASEQPVYRILRGLTEAICQQTAQSLEVAVTVGTRDTMTEAILVTLKAILSFLLLYWLIARASKN